MPTVKQIGIICVVAMMGSLCRRSTLVVAFRLTVNNPRTSSLLSHSQQYDKRALQSCVRCISTLSKTNERIHSGRQQSTISPFRTKTSTILFQSQRFHDLSADEYSLLADDATYVRPVVQWYPGHIAKAERQLSETLKAVDVVVEVRDARACKATAHPRVGEWCAGRPRIVVLTHLDTVPKAAANSWRRAYETLGAERWDDAPINRQVANQAQQARDTRYQFGAPDSGGSNTKNKSKRNNNNSVNPKSTASSAVTPVEEVLFVDAKQGQGIHALHRAIFKAGAHVQERRERRGLNPRALRVGIIGYPNVGKSALINKILGRRRARTANTPGVTRSLQWIRVRADDSKVNSSGSSPSSSAKKEFELLDSPGIIPAKMVDQSDALLLAACNCIGEAAYDNQAVAAYLCEWIKSIHIIGKEHLSAPEWRSKCKERYGFDPLEKIEIPQKDIEADPIYDYMTGEDMLFKVADNTCQGDPEDASRKIIQDFRAGRMGPISLQLAPETEEDDGQLQVPVGDTTILGRRSRDPVDQDLKRQIQEERARIALETAKERGLELPPMIEDPDRAKESSTDVGKGMFEGW